MIVDIIPLSKLESLEEKLQYSFEDKSLLIEAITHPSFSNKKKNVKNYQRLEFLGDKVLGFVVAEMLFFHFPDEREGEISRRHAFTVCGDGCCRVANDIGLSEYIILSDLQEIDEGRNNRKILENAIEAIIGAIYIDGGMDMAKRFIQSRWKGMISEMEDEAPKDPRSTLQEWSQQYLGSLPEYTIVDVKLEDSRLLFESTVTLGDGKQATASDRTRKGAKRLAAMKMLESINAF